MQTRVLGPTDEPALDSFLRAHRDGSMFLRSNIRKAGLVYRDAPGSGLYVAGFRGDQLVGVVAHAWTGMLLLQAPEQTDVLAPFCVRESGRKPTGLSGPLEQVRRARTALGLDSAVATIDEDESLFGLDLKDLVVPSLLGSGAVVCRSPRPDERDLLLAWRVAYDVEALGAAESEETRKRAAEFLDAQIADGHVRIAVDQGKPVSLSAFNAALPDIVQLGGIYTPPVLRGRGYAKAAVAASLLAARDHGASRAVLFTNNPSAVRSYEALGFRRLGDFGLVLFR